MSAEALRLIADDNPTREETADVIRNLVETGIVEWPEPAGAEL